MSNTGGVRAWRFLKRSPRYITDWWMTTAGTPSPTAEPFPMRTQMREDLKAAGWGLLAWEDPLGEGAASPFWAEAPTLRAVPAPDGPALTDLLSGPGVRVSGLRLLDGTVVLKVEQGDAAVQMRIAAGASFDPAGGVDIALPAELDLRTRLRRISELWPIAAADSKKAAGGFWTRSCCWRWTAGLPAGACA